MIFTILGCGTSTGVPVPGCECSVCRSDDPKNKRLRASGLITTNAGNQILIDASTDFRHQALRIGLKKVDSVLFTHAHADHILGIDDLRGFNFIQKKSIPCFGTKRTLEGIKSVFSYVFNPNPHYQGGGIPRLELHEIADDQEITIADVKVQAFPLLHARLPVTGFRIGSLAYATDTKIVTPRAKELLHGVHTLILDGLRMEDHPAHLTIPEAIAIAKELGVTRTYLTHMTHTVDYRTVSEGLPPGVELAYDGLQIQFE